MDHTTWQQATHGPVALRQQELARHERRLRRRRHARDRAAEDTAAMRAARPGARPNASWVMGHSARWHDPDVAAEIRANELAEEYRDMTVIKAGAGSGFLGAVLIGIWRGVRAFRRPPRR